MRLGKPIIAALAVLMLSGCARTLIREVPATMELLKLPPVGEVATVQVGESLIATEKQAVLETLQLEREALHRINSSKAFVLPGNAPYFFTHRDDTGRLYASPGITWRKVNPDGSCVLENGACDQATDADRGLGDMNRVGVHINDTTNKVDWVFTQENLNRVEAFPKTDIEFRFAGRVAHPAVPPELKRELIYLGGTGTAITLSYRESMRDMARPAFTQELKYDLSQSDIVGYKGARFQVLKADNVSIQYKVLNQLD